MSDKPVPILDRITDTVIGMAMYAPIGLTKLLPYRWRIPFMGWLTARVIAPIAGYDRRVRDNLAHVLPDLPEAEVRRLMRAVPNNAGRNMAELYSTAEFIARTRTSKVYGPGIEAIQAAQAQYIKQVAGSDATKSAAEQIAHAKQLLDSGTITPEEFEQLKAKALS